MINSTVSGNTSPDLTWQLEWGSPLPGSETGVLDVINSTVTGEQRVIGWGVRVTNSIIATALLDYFYPYTAACWAADSGVSVASGGGNIESPYDSCGLTEPTDLVNVSAEDLKLGPLADNGGPTMTHALLPGSVAIDRIPPAMCVDADGQPLTTDQRGVARPQGGACDVGAFEWADCSGTACDDGNDCTADYCDPAMTLGVCNNALPDGTFCGTDGVCEAGACRERSWGTAVLIETDDRAPRRTRTWRSIPRGTLRLFGVCTMAPATTSGPIVTPLIAVGESPS